MCQDDPGLKQKNQTSQPRVYCDEARRLLDQFGQAVQELVKLHEEQFLAVVEGDSGANRFDLLIHDANERKQNAKYAYMAHLDAHRCFE
jgi:hypothetical protein